MICTFILNGSSCSIDAPGEKRLLDVLRDDCGLIGTKEGCGKGECGACSVLLDGRAVNSCLVPFSQVEGREVTTIEGLDASGESATLLAAFVEEGAVQCGFCIPGMVIAAKSLLNENPHPTREEIQRGLSGNLCRCTGYSKILTALEKLTQ